MAMISVLRTCPACNRVIKGRADKKYCNAACRNNYNNRLNSDATPLIRSINNALRRNRRILHELLAGKGNAYAVAIDKLRSLGFRFQYFTHTYSTRKGETYHYCYDYGYLWLKEKNMVLVVKEIRELRQKNRALI